LPVPEQRMACGGLRLAWMPLTPEGRLRAMEWSKRVSILLVFAINVVDLWLRFMTNTPKIVVALIFLGSIIPYLIHLHYISARLMPRDADDTESV